MGILNIEVARVKAESVLASIKIFNMVNFYIVCAMCIYEFQYLRLA